MSYTPTTWQTGDTITAEKLNNMESGIEAAVASADKLPVGGGSAGQDHVGSYLRYLQDEYNPNGRWIQSSPLDLFENGFFFEVPITMDEYFNLDTNVSILDYIKAQNAGKTIIGVLNDTYRFILHPTLLAGRYGVLPAFDYSSFPTSLDSIGFSNYMGTIELIIYGLADEDPAIDVYLRTWQNAQPT